MILSLFSSYFSSPKEEEEERVFELFGEEVEESKLTINEKRWLQLTRDVSFEDV